jgi:periplasmic divalent cation tolerance protein
MDTKATLIMTTVDSEQLADSLATMLIERRLAACVQRVDITSRYRWDGEVRRDDEILLLVKTSTDARDAAMRAIEENHTYEVPEIIALPIAEGLPAYLEWVTKESSS